MIFGALLIGFSLSATAAPTFKPSANIKRAVSEIKIDGDLNEPAYGSGVRADNFIERFPGDNVKPEVETFAYVTYDEKNLYVAFVCHDDPKSIRATMTQRDQYDGDDAVGVMIDTYGDASWAYQFWVNPYGIQKDQLWSTIIGGDPGYDLIWQSAAKVTDSGYQVEIAVPFASMRFPNQDAQTWKMDFRRERPRESYNQYAWAAHDRNDQCGPCQWGTVEGIGNVQPGKGVEILPTMIANQSGALAGDGFDNEDVDGELSLGGKLAVNSDVTIEAAYNPDFSQIEGDAAQIDVNSTIGLFYPEGRPFFQEGSDIFRTLFNSFYTRTINDPEVTAKLTGRMDSYSVGYMFARDDNSPYMIPLEEGNGLSILGKSTVNVLRGSRAFGSNSRVGIMLSDRRFDVGGSGTVAALDGDIRLTPNFRIDGQYILTHTAEPDTPDLTDSSVVFESFDNNKLTARLDGESYYGTAFITRFRGNSRTWNFILDYNQVSPSYRTQLGFDPLVDYRNGSVYASYTFRPETGLLERITPSTYVSSRWHFNGDNQNRFANLHLEGQLRFAQTSFGTSVSNRSETYGGYRFDNLREGEGNANCRPLDRLGLGFYASHGRDIAYNMLEEGSKTRFNAYLDLKPIDRLIIEPNINFERSTRLETGEVLYEQFISRTRLRLQVNRRLSVRLVVQYNDGNLMYINSDGEEDRFYSQRWDIDPLITYRLSSFSVFYIGSTHDYRHFDERLSDPSKNVSYRPEGWDLSSRQFFMKLQYLFQI